MIPDPGLTSILPHLSTTQLEELRTWLQTAFDNNQNFHQRQQINEALSVIRIEQRRR